MISFESFDPQKHYEEIAKWWSTQNWDPIPPSHLSKTGIVCTLNSKPAAACWIYMTDSAFCLIEWIVADPAIRKQARHEVLNSLIEKANEVAKAMGFATAFMTVRSEALISRLKKNGFVIGDKGMTNLTRNLQGG
jgi:hypothetical protein